MTFSPTRIIFGFWQGKFYFKSEAWASLFVFQK